MPNVPAQPPEYNKTAMAPVAHVATVFFGVKEISTNEFVGKETGTILLFTTAQAAAEFRQSTNVGNPAEYTVVQVGAPAEDPMEVPPPPLDEGGLRERGPAKEESPLDDGGAISLDRGAKKKG